MMRLFHNPEIKRLSAALGFLAVLLSLAGFILSPLTGWCVLVTALLFCVAFLLFQAWKYRQIDRLSGYLKRISAGEYTLDVRDNDEGELSVLKSEIYKVTMMLSECNEKLWNEKVRLSDALYDISHQLKTPLTSMMMMADLLSDDKLPPDKRKEFTEQIRSQLERIQWLVSSLLKLSKLETGTANLRREPVNVRRLVDKASEPLLIPIEIKEQTLTLEGSDTAAFTGDLSWTAEALLNILKNCMEHTPKGGKLKIQWKDNPLFTEIAVSDNGEGIAKEDLPHIFTRFYRGKNAADDSVGIGLAMAKSIVAQQGGDIRVKSEQGKGTEFTIHMVKSIV